MIKLSYTEIAQRDLLTYYQKLTDEVGSVFAEERIDAMFERCEDIARFPEMGRRRPNLDAFGLSIHGVTQADRTILYTRRGTTLHVVRVLGPK